MLNDYIEWLQRQGSPLMEGGNTFWRLYNNALIPAQIIPSYPGITEDQAKLLLGSSTAFLLRYTYAPTNKETPWWYISCRIYGHDCLSSKMRNQIKRGYKNCRVERVDALWIADNSYACYRAAFGRYSNAVPVTEEQFRKEIIATSSGPYEYWAVLVGDVLAGFGQCILDNGGVALSSLKYDPEFLKLYSSYAMTDAIVSHYVVEKGLVLSNGSRSILHDTNMQEFLEKFGFTKQYCLLKVLYKPWFKLLLSLLFPLAAFQRKFCKNSHGSRLSALFLQEAINRECDSIARSIGR